MSKTQWKKALLCAILLTGWAGSIGAASLSDTEDVRAVDFSQEEKEISATDKNQPMVLTGNNSVLQPSYEESTERPKTKKSKRANTDEKVDTSISKENPMVIHADKMRYNDTTGDVDAMGNVDIHHMMDSYQTQYVYGNTISQKYVVPGEVKWNNPTTRLKADRAEYDAAKAMGKFENLSGWEGNTYYFQGASGTYDRNNNLIVVQNGYFTTRHAVAKVPDYRIEAESIDIYPGDHYVAHHVKLMAKNTTLLTMSSYKGSLKKDNNINPWTLIPRPMFDSDNGFGLHNAVEVPLDDEMNLTAYAENRWYTKSGYKPDIGVRYDTPVGRLNFHYAEEESSTNDDGGIWVKKRPSLEFDSNHFYLFGSRFYTGIRGEWGYWEEGSIKGSYKGYDAYVSSDPWKLGKFMRFNWNAGYAKDYYGATDNIRTVGYYGVGLSGQYRSVASWVSYTNRNISGFTPYQYARYSSDKPLAFGFRVQATPLDAFSLAWSIDTKDGTLDHRYWTYYRDLHSFYAWLRYDDIERETQFMVMPKDFRF